MRVAVCIPGQLRNYLDTYQFAIKNLIEPLSADVFIYSDTYDENLKKDFSCPFPAITRV